MIKQSTIEAGVAQHGIIQISFPKITSNKVAPIKHGFTEVGHEQFSPSEISPIHIDSSEISFRQVGSNENRAGQSRIRQVNTSQIRFYQVPLSERDLAEIPLTSSIPLQQFLSSHSTNLQNTTNWTNFLQGSTPFDLNLEITDLPTGQLAEATLTHFDANGLPIGGTIAIDDDANGLGWFIDEPPWENSEFNLLQTETLLRATPGSAAYGRYDLLTTVLHELGHLAGIIHGNPAYSDRIQTINGSPTDLGNGYEAQLTNDLSHLADPTQLMSPYLAPGIL